MKYKLIKDNNILRSDPLPSDAELELHYEQKYYQDNLSQYSSRYSEEEINYFNFSDKLLSHTLKHKFSLNKGKLLEYGCGEGFSLNFFTNLGWETFGVDFSDFGIKSHNPDLINKTTFYKGSFLDDTIIKESEFDLIIMRNVLEHVIDLDETIKSCHRRLKVGGCLYIAVPNEFNRIQKKYLLEKNINDSEAPWFIPPEHLSYFTPDSLISFMQPFGFDVQDVLTDFPIDMFLLDDNLNYYNNPNTGSSAHNIRVKLSNLMSDDIESACSYFRSQIKMGIGRSIFGFFKKA